MTPTPPSDAHAIQRRGSRCHHVSPQASTERVWRTKPKHPDDDQVRTRRAYEGLQSLTPDKGCGRIAIAASARIKRTGSAAGVRAVARSPAAAPLSPPWSL